MEDDFHFAVWLHHEKRSWEKEEANAAEDEKN